MFEPSDDIFQNKDALTDTYVPESIHGREDELEDYKNQLQPVINGNQPYHIFLYGKNGVGKTAITKYLLRNLKRDAQKYNIDVTTIYLNCESLTSSYQVSVALVNELREPRNTISRTGHPRDAVDNFLWDELDAIGGPILIVLDEIDNIGDDESILYQISRARANGNLSNAKPGIIGICNDFRFGQEFDSSVADSLRPRELHFAPYEAGQLEEILTARAQKAYVDTDVLAADVIPLCAALAAQDHGSARQALDLLREAGTLAQLQNDAAVTESHVRDAQDALEQQDVKEVIHDLSWEDQFVLATVCGVTISEPESIPARKRRVHSWYGKLANIEEVDKIAPRTLHRHLTDLVKKDLLSRYDCNQGPNGGSYYEYEIAESLESVLAGLEETSGISETTISDFWESAKSKGLIPDD